MDDVKYEAIAGKLEDRANQRYEKAGKAPAADLAPDDEFIPIGKFIANPPDGS